MTEAAAPQSSVRLRRARAAAAAAAASASPGARDKRAAAQAADLAARNAVSSSMSFFEAI